MLPYHPPPSIVPLGVDFHMFIHESAVCYAHHEGCGACDKWIQQMCTPKNSIRQQCKQDKNKALLRNSNAFSSCDGSPQCSRHLAAR